MEIAIKLDPICERVKEQGYFDIRFVFWAVLCIAHEHLSESRIHDEHLLF